MDIPAVGVRLGHETVAFLFLATWVVLKIPKRKTAYLWGIKPIPYQIHSQQEAILGGLLNKIVMCDSVHVWVRGIFFLQGNERWEVRRQIGYNRTSSEVTPSLFHPWAVWEQPCKDWLQNFLQSRQQPTSENPRIKRDNLHLAEWR